MAVKAYRDTAKKKNPEIIVPVTIHAAFDKAGEYFGVKVIHIPVDKNGVVNPADVEKAITRNTIMVQNRKSFVCDILRLLGLLLITLMELWIQFHNWLLLPRYRRSKMNSQFSQKHNIGFHTDACLGGFFLPWVQKAGLDSGMLPLFDFRVPGVTSISADTHKVN